MKTNCQTVYRLSLLESSDKTEYIVENFVLMPDKTILAELWLCDTDNEDEDTVVVGSCLIQACDEYDDYLKTLGTQDNFQ